MTAPRRRRISVRRQIVLLTAGATALGMVLLAVVLQVVLAHLTDNDVERVLANRAATAVDSITRDGTDPAAVTAAEPGVVVYDGSGRALAGRPPARLERAYAGLTRVAVPTTRDVDDTYRVRATPFESHGEPRVVVLSERLEPYEEAERLALIVSLVTGVLTTAAAATVTGWAVRRALRPVAEMAATAADWSRHDLGRRFDLGPPDTELSALAGTLDTLLDEVSTAIRSEQRLTSELAHELRTPLTTIQAAADLIGLRDDLGAEARRDLAEISAAAQRMALTVTTLLSLARQETALVEAGRSSLCEVVAEVVATARADAGLIDIRTELLDARLGLPHDLAVRALAPVVENALRFAHSRVTVEATGGSTEHGPLDVVVSDDGPGLETGGASWVFEPGRTSGSGSGAGLGLALARRVARSVGGDVVVADGGPGARFVVRLPRG